MNKQHQAAIDKILEAVEQNATELNLSGMGLNMLPKEILNLKQLKKLHIQDNSLSTLMPEIGQFLKLQELNVSKNKLSTLPRNMKQLKQLRFLRLSENKLVNLPKCMRSLTNLEELHLDGNIIGFLPDYIGELAKLKRLYLSNNPLKKMPIDLARLNHLQVLDMEGCKLNYILPDIAKLGQLRELYLSNNTISYAAPELGKLHRLELLDLSHNQLSGLPVEMGRLKSLRSNNVDRTWEQGLNLRGNQFSVPEEVYKMEPPALMQYIYDLQASSKNKALLEAKLIFIGSGYVGKTSLIRMLMSGQFDPTQNKTDGIDIHEWNINRGKDEVRLHIWDFGGQEIMHATHKFFMTSRSAYVLVINPRAEDKYGDSDLVYWLKLINSYAGAVPVVVVVNKCEVHKMDIPKGELTDKYPNIVGFVETSCKVNKGIGELRKKIRQAIGQLSHIDDMLPQSYFDIKELLEERNEDYIPYNDYQQLCKEVDSKFKNESMNTLMQLLHDLGVMLNFGSEDRRLMDTQVLNPEWVTKGVYQIINSSILIKRKGIISTRDITKILDAGEYPTEKERFYIMDMMDRFELCYQMPNSRDTFFVPGAFPKDRPSIQWPYKDGEIVRFQYHFDVMPSSIMSRFIVKVHPFIRGRDFWRNGVVIRKGKCDAFIKADPEDRKIFIYVGGRGSKRELLSFIRSVFDLIHLNLNNLAVKSMIPVDKEGKVVIDYDRLLFHEEEGEEYILVSEIRKKLNVRELLNGIETSEESKQKQVQQQKEFEDSHRRPATVPDVNPLHSVHTQLDPMPSSASDQSHGSRYRRWLALVVGLIIFLAALSELVTNLIDLMRDNAMWPF